MPLGGAIVACARPPEGAGVVRAEPLTKDARQGGVPLWYVVLRCPDGLAPFKALVAELGDVEARWVAWTPDRPLRTQPAAPAASAVAAEPDLHLDCLSVLYGI